jgi:hypothetical protein
MIGFFGSSNGPLSTVSGLSVTGQVDEMSQGYVQAVLTSAGIMTGQINVYSNNDVQYDSPQGNVNFPSLPANHWTLVTQSGWSVNNQTFAVGVPLTNVGYRSMRVTVSGVSGNGSGTLLVTGKSSSWPTT